MTTAVSSVRINKQIDRALSSAAKDFNTTRANIVKHALLDYLEDMADIKAINSRQGEKDIPWEQVKAELDL